MSTTASYVTLALVAAFAALTGAFLAYLRSQRRITALKEENATLKATVEIERRTAGEKVTIIENARTQLSETFTTLSSQALRSRSSEMGSGLSPSVQNHFDTRL